MQKKSDFCPFCKSENIISERRPDGAKECKDCGSFKVYQQDRWHPAYKIQKIENHVESEVKGGISFYTLMNFMERNPKVDLYFHGKKLIFNPGIGDYFYRDIFWEEMVGQEKFSCSMKGMIRDQIFDMKSWITCDPDGKIPFLGDTTRNVLKNTDIVKIKGKNGVHMIHEVMWHQEQKRYLYLLDDNFVYEIEELEVVGETK